MSQVLKRSSNSKTVPVDLSQEGVLVAASVEVDVDEAAASRLLLKPRVFQEPPAIPGLQQLAFGSVIQLSKVDHLF